MKRLRSSPTLALWMSGDVPVATREAGVSVEPELVTNDVLAPSSQVALAVQRLRSEILSGALVPGERLIEGQLTRRFGTIRAPLREALRLLGQQGLIEHLPRRGCESPSSHRGMSTSCSAFARCSNGSPSRSRLSHRGSGWPGLFRSRHRHRRFRTRPGRDERDRRLQADPGPDQHRRRGASLPVAGLREHLHQQRRRRHHDLERNPRL